MTPSDGDWSRVKGELLAVLELEPGAGRERLRSLAGESPELAAEVAALLAHADESAPFLEVPALASHREAARLRAALLAADPLDARAGDDLAESRWETAKALAALGRTAEAETEIAAAVEGRRDLIAHDPGNVRWRDALASVLATRAELELRRGQREAAEATLAEALAIRRRLAAESPDFATNRTALDELERRRPGAR